MALQLLIGPPGGKKTGLALQTFKRFTPSEHLKSVRFIVKTIPQAIQIRRLALADSQFPGFLGDSVCTLHHFASEIALEARPEAAGTISYRHRRIILEALTLRESSSLRASGMNDCPNFAAALDQSIASLQSTGLNASDFHQALNASGKPGSLQRLRTISAMYSQYEDLLHANSMEDAEDLMRRAVELTERNPASLQAFKCVILDGFTIFSPVQKRLIREMAQCIPQLIITLDYEENRPQVFAALEPTLRFIQELPNVSVKHVPAVRDGPITALRTLQQQLFSAGGQTIEPDQSVRMLVGTSEESEAELVSFEIERLIRDHGFAFRDIAVIPLRAGQYQRIDSVFRRRGIPLVERALPLSESTLARTILLCLEIAEQGWKPNLVQATLQSCYIPFGPDEYASRKPSFDPPTPGDESHPLYSIAALENSFTVPGAKHLRRAVHALVNTFSWPDDDELLQEDSAAWKSITRIMDAIADSEEILGKEFTADEFLELLEKEVRREHYLASPRNEDGVTLASASSLGDRKFRAVFIVGLSETLHSSRRKAANLLADFERLIPDAHFPDEYESSPDAPALARFKFYSAIAAAKELLFLSSGAPTEDDSLSPCLNELERLFL